MRSLLALSGFALLLAAVASIVVAASAIAAPADDDEPTRAAACTDLPMRSRAVGLVVGERVRSARCAGAILSFECLSGEPAVLLFDGPRQALCSVRVSELVRP